MMNPTIFTPEQLGAMRAFIGSRSLRFKDPVLMSAIVDELSGKIVQLMADGKSFEKALQEAHDANGVYGFAVIADAEENRITGRYRKFLKLDMKKILLSAYLPALLLLGAGTYLTGRWLQSSDAGLVLLEYAYILLPLCYLISFAFLGLGRNKRLRQYPTYKDAATRAFSYMNWFCIPFFVACFSPSKSASHVYIMTLALLHVLYALQVLVYYRFHQRLQADISAFQQDRGLSDS